MKIALCQMSILWEDKKSNTEKALGFICEAAAGSVDLILFPEMSLTGFSMQISKTQESRRESVKLFSAYAREYQIAIGLGWVMEHEGKAENHYTLIDKSGKEMSDYAKIHPFSYAHEDDYFVGGEEITVFEFMGSDICSFICYDLRFPDIFQIASKRAGIIIVPANWPKRRSEHWKCLLRARAIENQVYMIGVNCTGCQEGLEYSGNSCIIDPLGEILCELAEKEGLLIYELEDHVKAFRKAFPVKKDRRENLYERLKSKEGNGKNE